VRELDGKPSSVTISLEMLEAEAIAHESVNALTKSAATKDEPAQKPTSAKDELASTKDGRTGT
jgi:hypothetical protein